MNEFITVERGKYMFSSAGSVRWMVRAGEALDGMITPGINGISDVNQDNRRALK